MNKLVLLIILTSFGFVHISAQSPIVQTRFTADPAPMVYKDTVFLYTTHDEDGATGFMMKDWLLYTSTDMVNWTDHGPVASLKSFDWVKTNNGAWAEQVIARNGKFYMYCPIHGNGIGVLVADSPYGPFTDPLGKPLVWQREHWNDIDPTVFIDYDGQAYMYWGNPELYMVRLNNDMISYSGDIVKLRHPEHYQEGPWFYKRAGHYYLAFASTCCPEGIGYAMSEHPEGPWKTMGYIMRPTDKSRGNHPGVIDYKGNSYVFGLNYDLMHLRTFEHHEQRSVSVERMYYRSDGTIKEVPYWSSKGVAQVQSFNPYQRVQSETMSWGQWVKTECAGYNNMVVYDIQNDDYIMLKGVDFGKGAKVFKISAQPINGGIIEIHIDGMTGDTLGECQVSGTPNQWGIFSTTLKRIKGKHDLYFVFKGTKGDLFKLDWWEFQK